MALKPGSESLCTATGVFTSMPAASYNIAKFLTTDLAYEVFLGAC